MSKKIYVMSFAFLFASNVANALNPEYVAVVTKALQGRKATKTEALLKNRPDIVKVVETSLSEVPGDVRLMKSVSDDVLENTNRIAGDKNHKIWIEGVKEKRPVSFKAMGFDGSPITTEAELLAYFEKHGVPEKYRVKDADGQYTYYKKGVAQNGSAEPKNTVYWEDLRNIPENYHLSPANRDQNEVMVQGLSAFTKSWLKNGGKIDNNYMSAASNLAHEIWMKMNSWQNKPGDARFLPFNQLTPEVAKQDVDAVLVYLKTVGEISATKAAATAAQSSGTALKGIKAPTTRR